MFWSLSDHLQWLWYHTNVYKNELPNKLNIFSLYICAYHKILSRSMCTTGPRMFTALLNYSIVLATNTYAYTFPDIHTCSLIRLSYIKQNNSALSFTTNTMVSTILRTKKINLLDSLCLCTFVWYHGHWRWLEERNM